MENNRNTYILLLVLLTVIVFAGSLNNGFVWDDKFLVINNPYVKNWSYVPDIFATQLYDGSHIHSNFYRPLQLISFALDYSVWGLNPFGYHLTNLLLHISNVILVYLILTAIGTSGGPALLAASLFAVSPPISGITYYISARSDLLMAFFLFLSFLLFVRYRRHKGIAAYTLSIISFALSLLCKEMGLVLVALLVLETFRADRKSARRLVYVIPYALTLAVYIIIRFTALSFSQAESPAFAASIPLWRRLLTDFIIVPKYLGLLIFPYGLHMEWFIAPARGLFQPAVITSVLVCALLIYAVKKLSLRSNLVLFGSAWFLLSLLPVLNIYPISVLFGEGWLYVSSVGFYTAFAGIFKDIIIPDTGKVLRGIFAGSMLIYYSMFTFNYGKVWEDGVSLFNNVLKYEKDSPFIYSTYNNLGVSYYDKGEPGKAISYYKKSMAVNPRYENPCNNLGVVYAGLNRPVLAIKYFKKAINIKRDYLDAYSNLSHAYKSIGLTDMAIKVSNAAIKIDPYFYNAYVNLGYIYTDIGELEKAIISFRNAKRLRGAEFEPHYCLGTLYIKKNRFRDALREYLSAKKLGLGDYKFYNELGFVYLKNGKFKESEQALIESIRLNPDQSEPHNNLGNIYSILGYFKPAIDEYKKALEIDPANAGVRDNLEKTEAKWKDHTYQ